MLAVADGLTTGTELRMNLERIVQRASERGVQACLHPHVGTMVERGEEKGVWQLTHKFRTQLGAVKAPALLAIEKLKAEIARTAARPPIALYAGWPMYGVV